jgi:oxygen-independent coproporphyrinogen-3 oxidase
MEATPGEMDLNHLVRDTMAFLSLGCAENLHLALDLAPEHLSLYALTVEEGTPLAAAIAAGELPPPDDDLAADMYEHAEATLAADYAHYEISNWARRLPGESGDDPPALACRHNLKYWHNAPYLGLGAAAYSYDGRYRAANVDDPAAYIARVRAGESARADAEETDRDREMGETMMLGLRLSQGVAWGAFEARFGVALRAVYGAEIDELVGDGLLHADDAGIRLTPRGRLLGNRVFGAFLR